MKKYLSPLPLIFFSWFLLYTSFSYAETIASTSNINYGPIWGIIICGWIAHRYRKKPIGGWLLFYYIKLYGGSLVLFTLPILSLSDYIPGNWDNRNSYIYFLLWNVPIFITTLSEIIVSSFLLSKNYRNQKTVNILRIVFIISILFSLLAIGINVTYWNKELAIEPTHKQKKLL